MMKVIGVRLREYHSRRTFLLLVAARSITSAHLIASKFAEGKGVDADVKEATDVGMTREQQERVLMHGGFDEE